jgi:hypothetical protein
MTSNGWKYDSTWNVTEACALFCSTLIKEKKRNIFSRVETYKKNKKVNAVAGLTNLSFFQGDFFFTF